MQLNPAWIFVPVLIQLTLTILLYFLLARRKRKAAEAGDVNEARRGIYDDAWPESVILVNNCIRNQFELPVLFYVVTLSLWSLNAVSWPALALAGIFALSRLVRAYIHTGANVVPIRRRIFIFGVLLVAALCVLLARAVAIA